MPPTDLAELRRLLADGEAAPIRWAQNAAAIWNAVPALLDELEAAREAVSEESNRWVSVIRGIDPEALCDFHDEHGSQDYLKTWLDDRDRHTKLLGAAEELEKVAKEEWRVASDGGNPILIVGRLQQRAAQLRLEAEDGTK